MLRHDLLNLAAIKHGFLNLVNMIKLREKWSFECLKMLSVNYLKTGHGHLTTKTYIYC